MSDCVAPAGLPSRPKTFQFPPWDPSVPYRDGATGLEDLPEDVLFAPIRLNPDTIGLKLDEKLEAIIRRKNYQIIDDKTNFIDYDCIMLCSSDPNRLK
jgi:hypothetical protein